MRIVIAPDSFKESLPAQQVCEAIARGARRVLPQADLELIAMADGGEGTVDALLAAGGGREMWTTVHGPLGESVTAKWALLEGKGASYGTAVLEMAAASGLALVPPKQRNPLLTTTLGTGELIRAAMDAGATRIIIGIGGSATTDGGAGAAQAIGVRFLDARGEPLPPGLGGGRLAEVDRIDMSARDARIATVRIAAACDVDNPLCGPKGAAAIYGPQKGATPEQIPVLDRNLARLADLISRDTGKDVRDLPGAGAAGGLGAGLIAFFEATLESGFQLISETVRLDERIAGADLIITGEGRIDAQSMMGKVVSGVGRAGKAAGIPVIALVGCVGQGAESTLEVLESYHPITPPGIPLPEALNLAGELLESAAERVLRARCGR